MERPWTAVGVIAVATVAGAAIPAYGNYIAAGVAIFLATVVLLPRRWATVTAYVAVTILASSSTTLRGESVSIASIAGPARPFLLALFTLQSMQAAERVRSLKGAALAPFLPLFAAILFSIVAAPDTPDDRLNALPFIALVGGAVLLSTWATEKPERVRRLVLAMANGYALVAVLNVVLLPLVTQSPLRLTSDGSRFQGILENPNAVGVLGFAGVPLLIAAAGFHERRSPMRRVYGLLATGLGFEVLASLSRSGIAGTIVALVLMVAITGRHRIVLGVSLAVAAGAAATLVVGFGAVTSLGEQLRLDSLSAAGGRVLVVPLVVEEIKRRPVIGHGFGSEPQIIQSFGNVTGWLPGGGTGAFVGNYSGNVFLDVSLELGLIGLVCFLVAVFIPLRRLASAFGRHASANQRLVAGVAVGGVAGGLVNAQGESILFSPGSPGALGFWFLVALCAAEGVRAQQRARQPLVL